MSAGRRKARESLRGRSPMSRSLGGCLCSRAGMVASVTTERRHRRRYGRSQSPCGFPKGGGHLGDVCFVMRKGNVDLVVALEHTTLAHHRVEPLAEGHIAADR